jgi:diguanylate cyclase
MLENAFLVLIIGSLAVTQLALGLAIGWWWRDRRENSHDGNAPQAQPQQPQSLQAQSQEQAQLQQQQQQLQQQRQQHDLQQQQTQALMQHLQQLAVSMGDDMNAHTSRMAEINDELTAIDGAGEEGGPKDEILGVVERIVAANKNLQDKLSSAEQRIQEQAKAIDVHLAEARIDTLTELANRRAFNDEVTRRFAELQRVQHPFSLLVLDIDHFKKFNDTYGHHAGDQVLRHVARMLASTMREMDLVARYGGEEFAIVLPNTDLAKGMRAAERARAAVEGEQIVLDGKPMRVTVSAGVAQARGVDNPRSIFQRADRALYTAKENGRNRAYYHDEQNCLPCVGANPSAEPMVNADQPGPEPIVPGEPPAGLPNRRQFVDELRRAVAEAIQARDDLALIFVGIDQMSKITRQNDQALTDRVMRETADVLARGVEGKGLVLRSGWEEYAVVLPRFDVQAAGEIDKQLRELLMQDAGLVTSMGSITISSGITEVVDGDDAATFATRAEAALDASRQSGGNCSHVQCQGTREAARELSAV